MTSPKSVSIKTVAPDAKSELFQLAHYPLLDIGKGLEVSGSESLLNELLHMLVNQSLPQEMTALKKAYAKKDWQQIGNIAHKLKGCTLYCGVIRMYYACHYLEQHCKDKNSELVEKLYSQCMDVLEQTMRHTEQHINKES